MARHFPDWDSLVHPELLVICFQINVNSPGRLLPRWPWRRSRPWAPGMGQGTGPWSIHPEQEVQRDGSADRSTRRKEASIWASTVPPTSTFPWRSPSRFPLAPPSPPWPHWFRQELLPLSPRLLPWLPVLMLLLMFLWLPHKLRSLKSGVLFQNEVQEDFTPWVWRNEDPSIHLLSIQLFL